MKVIIEVDNPEQVTVEVRQKSEPASTPVPNYAHIEGCRCDKCDPPHPWAGLNDPFH